MRITTLLLASAACLIALAPQAFAQNAAALSGSVSSGKEGAMEGVVVSARKDGSASNHGASIVKVEPLDCNNKPSS